MKNIYDKSLKKRRLNVALYCREACYRQSVDPNAPSIQEERLRKEVSRLNRREDFQLEVVQCYSDKGKTGIDWNRPGLKSLLDEVKKGSVDAILVTDLDRLSRNLEYLKKVERILKRFKCELVSMDCPWNQDPMAMPCLTRIHLSLKIDEY